MTGAPVETHGNPRDRQLAAALVQVEALTFGSFVLASGKRSEYYVDMKRAITEPEILSTIAQEIAPYALSSDRIAGVELGAVPIAAAVSLASGKPYLIVRKAAKEHGTRREFEGDLREGERVLFVEDVVTTGGTLRGAIERLRGHGALIKDCVCVVDREEGGRSLLAEIGVHLHALLVVRDLLAER